MLTNEVSLDITDKNLNEKQKSDLLSKFKSKYIIFDI